MDGGPDGRVVSQNAAQMRCLETETEDEPRRRAWFLWQPRVSNPRAVPVATRNPYDIHDATPAA